jgi:SAM-dependent methyltransferase
MKQCNICGTTRHVGTLYRLEKPRPYTVLKCKNCGLVYTDLVFTAATDGKSFFASETAPGQYFNLEDDARRYFAPRLDAILALTDGQTGRLLDFGCGPGFFLAAAARLGFEPYGIDIEKGLETFIKDRFGFDVHIGQVGDAPYPAGFFDVITMWNVIEHLSDPYGRLLELKSFLRPGGLMAIETPDEYSLVRRLAHLLHRFSGGRLSVVHHFYSLPPYHTFCFSGDNLPLLLERAGLAVEQLRPVNASVRFITAGLTDERSGSFKRSLVRCAVGAAMLGGAVAGMPTRMIAFARKVAE